MGKKVLPKFAVSRFVPMAPSDAPVCRFSLSLMPAKWFLQSANRNACDITRCPSTVGDLRLRICAFCGHHSPPPLDTGIETESRHAAQKVMDYTLCGCQKFLFLHNTAWQLSQSANEEGARDMETRFFLRLWHALLEAPHTPPPPFSTVMKPSYHNSVPMATLQGPALALAFGTAKQAHRGPVGQCELGWWSGAETRLLAELPEERLEVGLGLLVCGAGQLALHASLHVVLSAVQFLGPHPQKELRETDQTHLLNGGVLLMDLQVMLCIHLPCLLATDDLIQILLVNLVHGSFQIIPQALCTKGQDLDFSKPLEGVVVRLSKQPNGLSSFPQSPDHLRRNVAITTDQYAMSCTSYLRPPRPKSMTHASNWTDEVENLYRFQQAGYRDELEYKQVKQVDLIDRWPETGFVKKLQRRDNTFYYYNKKRECEDNEVHKVKVYAY
ncbi:hypothetical protein JZ751_008774 [Albula glossodonta]|uniref:Meiosis expressed gene 1 protein homolog n=1 Tax=Albula glossodonta TaxID=121402 RepID=A0A8T2P1P5_9TELE|nr:hypothetical protein JZ751_008774 [Albula glossodonta]